MRRQRTRGWLIGSAGAAVLAIALAFATPPGRGGAGLGLGCGAAVLVLASALLGLRRRLLRLPLGSAAGWMRAHLFLGGLSLVFGLAHGRLRAGGPVSLALTAVLVLSVFSGVLGVILQRVLTQELNALSADTIFDLHQGVLSLRRRAYEIVWSACGVAPEAPGEADEIRRLLGAPPRPAEPVHPPGTLAGQPELARFYQELVLPFLRKSGGGPSPLARAADTALAFDTLEAHVSPPLRGPVRDLRDRCERLRAAQRQHRIHRFIHGWLLAHVPLSMALLILLFTHAVMALRY